LLVSLPDLGLNLGAPPGPSSSAAVIKVGVIRLGLRNIWYKSFAWPQGTALDNHVAFGQILEQFAQMPAAVERGCHFVGVAAGKLKEYVSTDSHDCGSHLGWVLFQELVCRHDADCEFPGFRQQSV
jgi:hypothetical protein